MALFLTIIWVLALGYSTIPLFWLVVHPFAPKWREHQGKIYPMLGFIWLVLMASVGYATAQYRHDRLYATPWSWLPAALLLLAGFTLYRRLTRSDRMSRNTIMGRPELRPIENEQKLITTGLHGIIRHPIYVAHWLILTGWTIGCGTSAMFTMWIFAMIFGSIMVRAEEKELEARFGEPYREYKNTVPMLIPKF